MLVFCPSLLWIFGFRKWGEFHGYEKQVASVGRLCCVELVSCTRQPASHTCSQAMAQGLLAIGLM